MHYEAFCSVRNSHPSWSCETFNYSFFSYFRIFLILKSSSTPRHMHRSVFCCIFWGTIWKWALSLFTCLSYLVLCSVISCWLGFPGIIVKSPQLKKATALNLGLFSLCPGLETFSRQWTGLVRECTSLVSYLSGILRLVSFDWCPMSWVLLLLIYYPNVFVVSGDRVNPIPFFSNLTRIKFLLNFWLHARHCR